MFSSAHTPVKPAGVFQTHVHGAADEDAGKAPFDRPVRVGVKAVEIVLAVRAAGVVRVGAARHAELVGVVAADILHRDAVLQRLAGKAAGDVLHAAHVGREAEEGLIHLVAGELVVRRQQRMRLGLAFPLLDLDQPLVAVASGGPGGVNRPAGGVINVDRVHPAVAHIGVVGDGEQLDARLALGVHPFPELLGIRWESSDAERRVRHLVAPEENIAVQVAVAGHRGPLVGAEGRELAGMVVFVGDLAGFLPYRGGDLRAHERLHRRAAGRA